RPRGGGRRHLRPSSLPALSAEIACGPRQDIIAARFDSGSRMARAMRMKRSGAGRSAEVYGRDVRGGLRNGTRWAARALVLVPALLLSGCAPAIIAGVIVLLSQKHSGSDCSPNGPATSVTLSGTVRYLKRLDSQTGSTGLAPSRGAQVEVL